MSFTEQDLDNLSKLARITLLEEEKSKMLLDIQSILGYVSEINNVDSKIIHEKETLFNVVREDLVTRESGSHSLDLLREAPEVEGKYLKVKQVLK